MRQLVKEFKPVKLRLKADLVSYPAWAVGLVNMDTPEKCVWWVLGRALNSIYMQGLSSGNLGSIKYPFIAITPSSSQPQSGCIWLVLIYGSCRQVKKFSYSIGPSAKIKKKHLETTTQNITINVQLKWFHKLSAWNNPRLVDMPLKTINQFLCIHCPVCWGCRIHRLHNYRRVRIPTSSVLVYDTKQSDGKVPVILKLWGMQSSPLLPSLPGPLWSGVVAPDLWVK